MDVNLVVESDMGEPPGRRGYRVALALAGAFFARAGAACPSRAHRMVPSCAPDPDTWRSMAAHNVRQAGEPRRARHNTPGGAAYRREVDAGLQKEFGAAVAGEGGTVRRQY
jgi:hypothetical protein